MATRSAEAGLRDAVGLWLGTLTFDPLDGGATYNLAAVLPRPPGAGVTLSYPTVALSGDFRHDNRPPVAIESTRDPDEGDGVVLEKTGELRGSLTLLVYAASEDQADEILGTIEQALCPTTEQVARLRLTATEYHDQVVVLRRRDVRPVLVADTAGKGVWKPALVCDASINVVREIGAADFQPLLGLTVGGDGEYLIDPIEGTTTPPDAP